MFDTEKEDSQKQNEENAAIKQNLDSVFMLARVQFVNSNPENTQDLFNMMAFEKQLHKRLKLNVNNPKSTRS